MIPFGHKDESKEQRAIFHAACERIHARFGPYCRPVRIFIRGLGQQKTTMVPLSARVRASVQQTQKAIEGINRHREIL